MPRKYVCLNVDEKTQAALESYAFWGGYDTSKSWSGNEIDKFNFHTTITYSKNSVTSLENGTYPISHETWKTATVVDVDVFTFEDKIIPVLLLDKNYDSLHMYMRRSYTYYGLYCTYPDYKPHISLSYHHTAPHGIEVLRRNMKNAFKYQHGKIGFPISFSSVTIEDILE